MFWNFNNNILNNVAVVDSESTKKLTYKELAKNCNSLECEIHSEKKQLVFLFSDNSIESIISYLTLLRDGHVCAQIDKKLNHELKNKLIEKYQPELILSNTSEIQNGYVEKIHDNSIYIYRRKEIVNHPPIHKDLSVLLSTSGSTGSPKFVRLSQKNLQSNADAIAKYLEISSDEKPITSLQMSYSYGLSVINSHFLKGATIILTNNSFVLRNYWDTFNHYECTSFAGVPYSYQLLEKINFSKLELPTLKTMTQAGGKLNENLQKKFNDLAVEKGWKFINMYGQTEATARITYLPSVMREIKSGSIGIVIPGGKLKIVDNGKDITESNAKGELVYYGDNVMLGYAEDRKSLSKGDELNGTLFTGDVGWRDSDEFFYITARKKRIIKLHGSRVNLDEMENVIEKNYNCSAICFGEDDILKIRVKSSDIKLHTKIKSYILRSFKIHPLLVNIGYLSSFPRNKNGKINYMKIMAME